MVRRLAAGALVVLGVSGYVSLGCRDLPSVNPAQNTAVKLAAATKPKLIPTTTTSTSTTVPPPPPTTVPVRASRAAVRPRYVGPATDDVWAALSRCEAGGRPNAVSRNGKYFGAFQFSLGTWHSMGMPGNPIDFPYEVQLDAAKRLQARSGWGQWPVCSRKLGLR
jgi:hypothetical protein